MTDSLALSIPTSDSTAGLSPDDDTFNHAAIILFLNKITDRRPDDLLDNMTDNVPACDGADTPRSNVTNDLSNDDGTPTEDFFSDDESTAETPREQAKTEIGIIPKNW